MNERELEEMEALSAKYQKFKHAFLVCRAEVQQQFLYRMKLNNEKLANELQTFVTGSTIQKRTRKVG